MSKIIFLNGCSSSGKTLIARSIGYVSDDLWLTLGIDTFIGMLPHTKENKYLSFIPSVNKYGPLMHIKLTEQGANFFRTSHLFAKILADSGHNLIIDEVMLDDEQLQNYAHVLASHTVYYVGVFCDLKIMQEREILRRDRHIGFSNDQIHRIHQGLRSRYDFKIDTTNISPFEAARKILDYIAGNINPQAFNAIVNRRV